MEENKTIVEAVSRMRNCHMSARKMRLVADIVRGKRVENALNTLKFTKKEAAKWIERTLLAAIANWKVLTDEEPEDYDLMVKEIWVDQGSQLKRFRPAPHGRAHRIRKHSCHINIIVCNSKELEEKIEEVEAVEEA